MSCLSHVLSPIFVCTQSVPSNRTNVWCHCLAAYFNKAQLPYCISMVFVSKGALTQLGSIVPQKLYIFTPSGNAIHEASCASFTIVYICQSSPKNIEKKNFPRGMFASGETTFSSQFGVIGRRRSEMRKYTRRWEFLVICTKERTHKRHAT